MEEYNPDNPNESYGGSDPYANAVKVPIDDRRPLSIENPKYKDKYEEHRKMNVMFMQCPECGHMGYHKLTHLDQQGRTYKAMGEVCDVCGFEDSYEAVDHIPQGRAA